MTLNYLKLQNKQNKMNYIYPMNKMDLLVSKLFGTQFPIVWRNAILIFLLHVIFVYASFLLPACKLGTILTVVFFLFFFGVGISQGCHRLWCHRTFKAKLSLRIFYMLIYCLTGQYDILQFARDHRLHHKYSDTDADPHNVKRGLFFSHVGWLIMKRHPELKEKDKLMDYSDLYDDPVLVFQRKYYPLLILVIHVFLPSWIIYYFMGETIKNAIFVGFFWRYAFSLNIVWSINSFSHLYGLRPYNSKIMPAQNYIVAWLTFGEGWHNFHHVFPWDYRVGDFFHLNSFIIESFAKLGLAYDLKKASPELVAKVQKRNQMCEEKDPFQ